MTKKILLLALCSLLLALRFSAEAQQTAKVPRIGYLSANREGISIDAFRQGLRDLGYIEGKNILVEYRYSEGKDERLPSLVAELVQLKVDVLVSPLPSVIHAAKQATKTIPIVMTDYWRPSRDRTNRQLGTPRWKHHRAHQTHPRIKRETTGTA